MNNDLIGYQSSYKTKGYRVSVAKGESLVWSIFEADHLVATIMYQKAMRDVEDGTGDYSEMLETRVLGTYTGRL